MQLHQFLEEKMWKTFLKEHHGSDFHMAREEGEDGWGVSRVQSWLLELVVKEKNPRNNVKSTV